MDIRERTFAEKQELVYFAPSKTGAEIWADISEAESLAEDAAEGWPHYEFKVVPFGPGYAVAVFENKLQIGFMAPAEEEPTIQ